MCLLINLSISPQECELMRVRCLIQNKVLWGFEMTVGAVLNLTFMTLWERRLIGDFGKLGGRNHYASHLYCDLVNVY